MVKENRLKGWSFESGLPDDYDFHIDRAYFGYLDEYMNGNHSYSSGKGHPKPKK